MTRFYDYVFNEKKPLFISTRAYHSYIANLDNDPRFRRDYVPIFEYHDGWILKRHKKIMYSGDYIRREIVEGNSSQYERMKFEASKLKSYPFVLRTD